MANNHLLGWRPAVYRNRHYWFLTGPLVATCSGCYVGQLPDHQQCDRRCHANQGTKTDWNLRCQPKTSCAGTKNFTLLTQAKILNN